MCVAQARLDQIAQRIATDEHGEQPPHIMQEDDPAGPWADAYDAAMKMAWELVRLGYLTVQGPSPTTDQTQDGQEDR